MSKRGLRGDVLARPHQSASRHVLTPKKNQKCGGRCLSPVPPSCLFNQSIRSMPLLHVPILKAPVPLRPFALLLVVWFALAACDSGMDDTLTIEAGLSVHLNALTFSRAQPGDTVRPTFVNESESTVYTTVCATEDTRLERWDGIEWSFADIWYGCRSEPGPTAVRPGETLELPELPVGGPGGVPSSVRRGTFRLRTRAYTSEAHWRAVLEGQSEALNGGPPYTGRPPYYAYSAPFEITGDP